MSPLTTDDTIVALSTPQGEGALGIIRLSGKNAVAICNKVVPGSNLHKAPSHTLHLVKIMDGVQMLDEAVASIFIAPNSYTKEDVVEISCHGSPYILQRVLELLIKNGARAAKPGEFTLRAFMNGRLDLSQAEAVSDLIAANSSAAHRLAIEQLKGGFSSELKHLRSKLLNLVSLLELELDFGEEDVEFANRNELRELLNELIELIERLSSSFRLGNAVKNGIPTVIAGRPNAGKSTLLNALLNEDRAMVSDIPGTTRDTIEEILNINGIAFRLTDTAGIRETTDILEKQGVDRTLQKIEQAALVVYLFDATDFTVQDIEQDIKKIKNVAHVKLLLVANKTDLPTNSESIKEIALTYPLEFISAKTGQGFDKIKTILFNTSIDKNRLEEGVIVTNARHFDALNRALNDLTAAKKVLESKSSAELIASDIRSAIRHLGDITGEITTDDILGNIFGKFCIGK